MPGSQARRYKSSALAVDGRLREQLIADYAPLVRFVAQRIAARLPASIDVDDLISAGVIGLMDAIEKYDPSRDNKFKTYAEFRIRGAILDELRAQDFVPRSVRDKVKRLDAAQLKLEQMLGRAPTHAEVAGMLAVDILDLHTFMPARYASERNEQVATMSADADSPFDAFALRRTRNQVIRMIEGLPEQQRLVVSLYYLEDMNLKEIGRILGVTESRVSQIHSFALANMRRRFGTP